MNDDYDNLFKPISIDETKYYVFIRVYDCKYSKFNVASVLDKGIKFVDEKNPITGICYNHASINATLDDRFLGMTQNDVSDLYIENINVKNPKNSFIKKADPDKSLFSIFYCELDKSDYNRLKKLLNYDFKYKDMIKYSVIACGVIGVAKLSQMIHKSFRQSSEAIENKPEVSKFVCSTFCSYILSNLNKFKRTITDYKMYSPNDLVTKLNMTHLVTGKWNEYNNLIKQVVKDHPEFKNFYNS